MAIRKHEFYEGAAIHQIARAGQIASVRHEHPFFVFNEKLFVYFKHSTKGRSPWGFTFTPEEQVLLENRAGKFDIVIGLICGSDGIAAITLDCYRAIAKPGKVAIRISCARKHGEHYAVAGPDGDLKRKVPPSTWQRVLTNRGNDETP